MGAQEHDVADDGIGERPRAVGFPLLYGLFADCGVAVDVIESVDSRAAVPDTSEGMVHEILPHVGEVYEGSDAEGGECRGIPNSRIQ